MRRPASREAVPHLEDAVGQKKQRFGASSPAGHSQPSERAYQADTESLNDGGRPDGGMGKAKDNEARKQGECFRCDGAV